jgi:hypothetical protein
MFENIPLDMRTYQQWLLWKYEPHDNDKPTKLPLSWHTGKLASVSNPETWCSFDQASSFVSRNPHLCDGIGFVFTKNDPYAGIDLDDANGVQENIDRQTRIYEKFVSYAETSPSGKGLHIIVKGEVPAGRRRSGIEVYSDSRFFTMTGNVYRSAPIADCSGDLLSLYYQMNDGQKVKAFYAGLEQAKSSDDEVLRYCMTAANASKFNDLFIDGDWKKYYPSQSEADFALIDIIAFFSENRLQTQNLFLRSKLAQREKSRAQYRVNYMLDRCFDRLLPPINFDAVKAKIDAVVKAANPIKENLPQIKPSYVMPPGLVGEIAAYIFEQAPRPVAEIALAGALALMAGICGRAYNISNTGLNHYILLLASTGSGKEAVASGIGKIMTLVQRQLPASNDFIGPGQIASPQALIKHIAGTSKCFVSVLGEFGLMLESMSSPHAPPHEKGLKRLILDLFNKSGQHDILRASIYSDKANNTSDVKSPAFSMLGESVPEKFYEILKDDMITSGLLPRFTTIEYLGKRPSHNEDAKNALPSAKLINDVATLCSHVLGLQTSDIANEVNLTDEASDLMRRFGLHADLNINSSDMDVKKQLWNRAHLKCLKLAGLIAVGIDAYRPLVTLDIASWACNLVEADTMNLLRRFDAGEVGIDNDETKQITTVINYIKEFLTRPWREIETYCDGMSDLHGNRIVPYVYLQRRLGNLTIFKKDKRGASAAIKNSISTLIERGDIQLISRATLAKDFSFSGVAYAITNEKILK